MQSLTGVCWGELLIESLVISTFFFYYYLFMHHASFYTHVEIKPDICSNSFRSDLRFYLYVLKREYSTHAILHLFIYQEIQQMGAVMH